MKKLIALLLIAGCFASCSTYMVHGSGPGKHDPKKEYSTGTRKHYGGAGSLGTWVTVAPTLPADSNYSIKTTMTFGQVVWSIFNFGFFQNKTTRVYVKK